MGQKSIMRTLCYLQSGTQRGWLRPTPNAKWFRPNAIAIWTPFGEGKKQLHENGYCSQRYPWKWTFHPHVEVERITFWRPPVSMGFATFPLLNLFATDRRNLFDSQLLVGVPADPWAKLETPWVSKVQRKLATKINTKVVTPSIIIPAENFCVQCTVSMPTCFVSLHFLRWPKEFLTTLAEVGLF